MGEGLHPTKVQAMFMVIFALGLFANGLVAVMIEGRSATWPIGFIQALNLALLVACLWWYRRAAGSPSSRN